MEQEEVVKKVSKALLRTLFKQRGSEEKKEKSISVEFAHCGFCGKSKSGSFTEVDSFARNHEIMCRKRRAA